MISLLDPEGVRHEVDVEAWISYCYVWVVQVMNEDKSGMAVRNREAPSYIPVNIMGETKPKYIPSVTSVVDCEARFAPSDAPITCLLCLGEPRGA